VAEGVPAHDIESALAHLAAPSLTALDRAAAAPRARLDLAAAGGAAAARAQVRPLFTRQQFVDLIGTAALANACCRLAVAVDLAESGADDTRDHRARGARRRALAAAVWLAAERRRLRGRVDAASSELQRMQAAFGRFAPGAVVDRIAARGRPSDAERRDVTVLFADLFSYRARRDADAGGAGGAAERPLRPHEPRRRAASRPVSKFIGDG
jgi:hypothetical protein